jgi:hypothetical protein
MTVSNILVEVLLLHILICLGRYPETAFYCIYNLLEKSNLQHHCLCIYFRIQRDDKHLNHGEISNWSLEGGFLNNEAKERFPRRAVDSGSESGLMIFLFMENENIDALCSYPIHGVKVSTTIIQNNTEIGIRRSFWV